MSDILSDLGPSMKLIGLIIVNAVDSVRPPPPPISNPYIPLMFPGPTPGTSSHLPRPPRLSPTTVRDLTLQLCELSHADVTHSTAPDSPVLPSYSPTLADKSRLSPALLPHFPTIDEKARPQFVAVSPEREPPRIGRRGSKQREWRSGSLGNLGVLEEKDEERCVEV